jgi:hypothetical protein
LQLRAVVAVHQVAHHREHRLQTDPLAADRIGELRVVLREEAGSVEVFQRGNLPDVE